LPNDSNITAPVTLLGIGRSGTSLIGASFGLRPDFSNCSETGGLIFGAWEGAKQSFVPHPREYWSLFAEDDDEKSAYFVREMLKGALPSDQPYWFQKPAGLPIDFLAWQRLPGARAPVTNFPVEWYWNVFQKSFPNSRYVTVFRDPFDVALSSVEFSGWDARGTLLAIVRIYEIIEYGWDKFQSIVLFDDMISDFEGTMRAMCSDIGIPFDPSMTKAIESNHSPVVQRSHKLNHRERWPELSGVRLKRAEIDVLERVWHRLGRELTIPIRSSSLFGLTRWRR
jgi:hypothetical protein